MLSFLAVMCTPALMHIFLLLAPLQVTMLLLHAKLCLPAVVATANTVRHQAFKASSCSILDKRTLGDYTTKVLTRMKAVQQHDANASTPNTAHELRQHMT